MATLLHVLAHLLVHFLDRISVHIHALTNGVYEVPWIIFDHFYVLFVFSLVFEEILFIVLICLDEAIILIMITNNNDFATMSRVLCLSHVTSTGPILQVCLSGNDT